MPRAFSSGAASIWSYALASPPNLAAITEVIAAVSVVLPWSTCPIVPTFTCGFVRSNFFFAILVLPLPPHTRTHYKKAGPPGGPHSLGAHERTRTADPVLTKNVLYLLSYVGTQ